MHTMSDASCARNRHVIVNVDPPLNPDLLRRHDKPGPRYTSYPTAPHFTHRFGVPQFQRWASETGHAMPARPLCEFSIEIDPRFVRLEDFGQLAYLGINRVSLGVQDFNTEVQLAVNRVQSAEQTFAAIAACRAAGITSINVDLMYGLPRQSPGSFRRTLAWMSRRSRTGTQSTSGHILRRPASNSRSWKPTGWSGLAQRALS